MILYRNVEYYFFAYTQKDLANILSMGVINIKTLDICSQPFMVDSDLKKGFLRGSIWSNLYDPYRFAITSISDGNEKDLALFMLEVYCFASIELTLYVTTHLDNKEAMNLLKEVNMEKNKLTEFFNNKYYSLCSGTANPESYFRSDRYVGV